MNKNNFRTDNSFLFHSVLEDDYNTFVQKMFENPQLINIPNKNKESLLHYCCFYGIIDKYYALINFNATPHLTLERNNLLHYACAGGQDNFLIVELVKSEISPVKKNIYGQTSLHMTKNEPISHYINLWCIRNNIDVLNMLDKNGNTIAHGCYEHGFYESAEYWVSNYPHLAKIGNKNNLIYNQLQLKNTKFCKI